MCRVLVINPGSTSTKVAVFDGAAERFQTSIAHPAGELGPCARVTDQAQFRIDCVARALEEAGVDASSFGAVVARGGLLKPVESGVYRVNEAMLEDLRAARWGEHASNLGALIAHHFASRAGCEAFIVDPVVVDEMDEIARPSGLPGLERRSIFHALNQKSVAREVAEALGKRYEECTFIVAHMGGGISVGAHREGRVVDVNNALDGDGPFSPDRAGGLPSGQLVALCGEGDRTAAAMRRKLVGEGGLVAYCGTNRLSDVKDAMARGDRTAALAFEAMAYQVSKEIAMHGATLAGRVDRIILTGGLAHDREFVDRIVARVRFLAPVDVIPGEREMLSLVRGCLAVAGGRETAKEYAP
jgi:butyrate kinase